MTVPFENLFQAMSVPSNLPVQLDASRLINVPVFAKFACFQVSVAESLWRQDARGQVACCRVPVPSELDWSCHLHGKFLQEFSERFFFYSLQLVFIRVVRHVSSNSPISYFFSASSSPLPIDMFWVLGVLTFLQGMGSAKVGSLK